MQAVQTHLVYRPAVKSRARGFTLIEIMSVLVILGLCSAIVIPQLNGRDDLKVSASARMVIADLVYAQNRAISTQKMQYVVCSAAAGASVGSYGLYDTAPFNTPLQHPVNIGTPYVVTFGDTSSSGLDGVTLDTANFDGQSTLCFDELGAPYAYNAGTITPLNSGAIILKSGTFIMTVKIEPGTGEITVDAP